MKTKANNNKKNHVMKLTLLGFLWTNVGVGLITLDIKIIS